MHNAYSCKNNILTARRQSMVQKHFCHITVNTGPLGGGRHRMQLPSPIWPIMCLVGH